MLQCICTCKLQTIYIINFYKKMEKQIQNIEAKLLKIDEGIERAMLGEFKNNELIMEILNKKAAILEKTRKKLIKLNRQSLINFSL